MGVQGLWQLLQSVGRPVSLESLEGKILAIDVSIWLHQAVKGMRDKDGNPVQNAHLISLFNKVCKLLFYRIKPVFVFDGGVPVLKKKTLAGRRDRREYADKQSNKAANKIIQNYLKSHAIRHVTGKTDEDGGLSLPSTSKAESDMFVLPPLPKSKQEVSDDTDSSTEEQQLFEDHLQNLDDVDIESSEFKSLPPELQHEILSEMKERRKRHSWYKVEELPEESTDFSNYQMAKLLEKSKLSTKIEDIRKEMNERQAGELTHGLDEEYYGFCDVESRRVVSDDSSRYVLIKGLSKKKKQAFILAQEQEKARLESLEKFFQEKDVETTDDSSEDDKEETEQMIDMWQKKINSSGGEKLIKSTEMEISSKQLSSSSRNDMPLTISDDNLSDDEVKVIGTIKATEVQKLESVTYDGTDKILRMPETIPDISDDGSEHTRDSNVRVRSVVKVIPVASNEPNSSKEKTSLVNIEVRNDDVTQTDSNVIESDHHTDMGDGNSAEQIKSNSVRKLQNSGGTSPLASDSMLNKSVVVRGESFETSTSNIAVENHAESISVEKDLEDINDQAKEDNKGRVLQENNDEDISDEDFVEVPVLPMVDELENSGLNTEASRFTQNSASDIPVSPGIHILAEEEDTGYTEKDDSGSELKQDVHVQHEFTGMSQERLSDLQHELREEVETLQAERGKQERMAVSITDQMYAEAQELLELFGLPYLVSPMEAEAQCAFLDNSNQTHGTITDDSDVWLFGGKRVYKNFFNKGKLVEFFRIEDLKHHFGLTRDKLIDIAFLCGSDYTPGLQGVGPVTALEILGEFPGGNHQGLRDFKEWWDEASSSKHRSTMSKIKSKLCQLVIGSGFLDDAVVKAYLEPAVDHSQEPFSWGMPDLDSLRDFTSERLRWSQAKTDEILVPVMQQLNKKEVQRRITSFFTPEAHEPSRKVKSKRVRRTVKKLLNVADADESPVEVKKKGGRKPSPKLVKNADSEVMKKGRTIKQSGTKHKSQTGHEQTASQKKKPKLSRLKKEVALSENSSDEDMNREQLAAIFDEDFQDEYVQSKKKSSESSSTSSSSEEGYGSHPVETSSDFAKQFKGKSSAKQPAKGKGKLKPSSQTPVATQNNSGGSDANVTQKSKSGITYSKRSLSSHLPL